MKRYPFFIFCGIKILEMSSKDQNNRYGLQINSLISLIIIKKILNQMNSMQTPTVVGIDVGSFAAKIAAVQKGVIDIVTNQANFRQTPMVIGYGEGQRKIGEIGNVKLKSNFKNTVTSANRYLGLKADSSDLKRQLMFCPCATKVQDGVVYFKVQNNGVQESFTAQQVMASYMTKLAEIIDHNNLDDRMVVFSVPSYFTEIEQKAMLNAAEISGTTNVKLVNENIAIGLDYSYEKKSELEGERNVVFIDFGHSTLSASLIRFSESKMEVILEKSTRNLGCRNIDAKIFKYIAKKFQEKTGLDIHENKKACLKLVQTIQRQRKILSGISETDISIECLMEDEDISQPFTRVIMYSEAADVFNSITALLTSLKEDIIAKGIKIDTIELVGGGTRIPKVIELIEQTFGMSASRTTNSSETIARGATLYAVQQSGLFRMPCSEIINRSSHNIYIQWRDASGAMKNEQQNTQPIILDNELMPCQKVVKIAANTPIEATILYTNVDSHVEQKIATLTVQQASSNELNLKFEINKSGYIKLVSVQDNSGQNIKHSIKFNQTLSQKQVSAFKAKEKEMYVKDFNIIKSYEKKNELEAFIYKQREIVNNNNELKKYLKQEEMDQLNAMMNEITQQMSSTDNQMGPKQYDSKKVQVENAIKQLNEMSKRRKGESMLEVKKLEDLKAQADETIKQIAQRFRNTQRVTEVYNQIKQISEWAAQAIKATKQASVCDLPVVPQKDIDQQHENIKILVNELVNPQRMQPEPQSRNPHNQTFGPRMQPPQQQQPKRRSPQQQQQFDPFGMSRSGFFGPSNNMWGFF